MDHGYLFDNCAACMQQEMGSTPYQYGCCQPPNMAMAQREPLYPSEGTAPKANNRRTTKPAKKPCVNRLSMKKTKADKSPPGEETCEPIEASNRKLSQRPTKRSTCAPAASHAEECGCNECDRSEKEMNQKAARSSQNPTVPGRRATKPVQPSKSTKASMLRNTMAHTNDCCCDDCDKSDNEAASMSTQRPTQRVTKSVQKPAQRGSMAQRGTMAHAEGCYSDDCDPSENEQNPTNDNCESDSRRSTKKSKGLPKDNMSQEKTMRNYLYDNPELKQSKKVSSGIDFDEMSADSEVWLLQCPKDFDPKTMMNSGLGKVGGQSIELFTDRFEGEKTLAVIAPEKAAEYEMICEHVKLLKPVGKIVVVDKLAGSPKKSIAQRESKKAKPSQAPQCDDSDEADSDAEEPCPSNNESNDDDDSCSEPEDIKPIAGKKLKKNLDDKCFKIETTVTVEKRKSNKNESKYLPIAPPEPSPITSKKRKSTKAGGRDNSWMTEC